VREVLAEHEVAVVLVEVQPEEAALGARRAAPRRGAVLRRRHGGRRPPERGALEDVGDLLALGHAEHELVPVGGGGVPAGPAAALGPEVAHVARAGRRGEVGLDLLEGVAALDAAALVLLEGDGQVGVDGRRARRLKLRAKNCCRWMCCRFCQIMVQHTARTLNTTDAWPNHAMSSSISLWNAQLLTCFQFRVRRLPSAAVVLCIVEI
jgi:hypothetical protein